MSIIKTEQCYITNDNKRFTTIREAKKHHIELIYEDITKAVNGEVGLFPSDLAELILLKEDALVTVLSLTPQPIASTAPTTPVVPTLTQLPLAISSVPSENLLTLDAFMIQVVSRLNPRAVTLEKALPFVEEYINGKVVYCKRIWGIEGKHGSIMDLLREFARLNGDKVHRKYDGNGSYYWYSEKNLRK